MCYWLEFLSRSEFSPLWRDQFPVMTGCLDLIILPNSLTEGNFFSLISNEDIYLKDTKEVSRLYKRMAKDYFCRQAIM